MIYENAESVRLKQEGQYKCRDAYQIHGGLLYHYTKLDTLWEILESDSLFARNIRFSNDTNEYLLGQALIKDFITNCLNLTENIRKEIIEDIEKNPIMQFMVCFCKNGDLLSQWRGYAKSGVSIGFDFTDGKFDQENIHKQIEYFCVLNNQKHQSVCEESKIGKYLIDDKSLVFVQMPYQVQYTSEKNDLSQEKMMAILKMLWDSNPSSDLKIRSRMLFNIFHS